MKRKQKTNYQTGGEKNPERLWERVAAVYGKRSGIPPDAIKNPPKSLLYEESSLLKIDHSRQGKEEGKKKGGGVLESLGWELLGEGEERAKKAIIHAPRGRGGVEA